MLSCSSIYSEASPITYSGPADARASVGAAGILALASRFPYDVLPAAGLGQDPADAVNTAAPAQAPVTSTGDVYWIGDDIPVVVTTQEATVAYKLEWVLVDADGIAGETYAGTGAVSNVPGTGRVAFLPTSMLTKKGIYYLSGTGIPRRRILLVDPIPALQDPLSWPFGLITSVDQIDRGAEMAEEFYRVGMRWFHFDYPISDSSYSGWPYSVNRVGASSDPDAGRISAGFEAFINRAHELGIQPIFKLMSHYSQIAEPNNLNGDFYSGLRKIQTYYRGKLRYWTIGNEVEGGGYSRFDPDQYAMVIKNMSIVLKGVDPDVQIIAGEFYSANNQHLDTLVRPAYRDYWDILSGHNVVRVEAGNAPVSDYLAHLQGLEKPVWDTEANGTMFGGPSEWSEYMQSRFPVVEDADLHSGINKHMARAFCLQTRYGDQWLPAFFNLDEPCLGVDLFVAMHYNANWETQWALRRHWISDVDQPSEQNHKVASFRTATDMLYGAKGVTRIPNTDVPDPYNASPSAAYVRADGYVYRYGPEYLLLLWQNTGDSRQDREIVLATDDPIVLYDSLGNRYPLRNSNGQVKVWVHPDAIYLRGFTTIPTFTVDSTGDDAPYFVTTPITQAVAGQTYYYDAWAYDSDVPGSGQDSLPRITYQLVDAPAGMTVAASTTDAQYARRTALLEWKPSVPGNYAVRLRATSEQGTTQSVDQVFSIVVHPAGTNLPPQILSHPTTTFGRVGYVWWYNANADDPNRDRVSYALKQAPAGMTIDPSSGLVQWTPAAAGEYSIVVTASDGQASSSQALVLDVGVGTQAHLPSKTAYPPAARLDDAVAFVIQLVGSGEAITVTDVLSAEFDYLSSVSTCPRDSLTYDEQAHKVTYMGTPPPDLACTLTIRTRVNTGQRRIVTNTATVQTATSGPYRVSALVILNGLRAHLPVILR